MNGGTNPAGETVRLTVETLGGLGDGIARHRGIPVYVPLAAPGDVADVLIGAKRGDGFVGRLMVLIEPGKTRRPPPCPHFGECGGCAVQHLAPETYSDWKEGLIGAALTRQDIAATIEPMLSPKIGDPRGLRRRATFAAELRGGKVALGFNARSTHKIVPIGRCLLLTDALNRLLGALPDLMSDFLAEAERGQAAVTDLDGAADILVVTPRAPSARTRERVAAFAARHGLARISWRDVGVDSLPETIVQREPCRISLAGTAVDFPPGGFLQPSTWGEETLQRLVVEGVGKAAHIADLFAGIGTFSLALAQAFGRRRWRIVALERDPALAEALRAAVNRAGLAGKLAVERRDLDRRPLLDDTLRDLDGVVLDPPRTGAKEQCQILARVQGPRRLVMVSCDPATFARDARILRDGGWRLERVTPVDQFLYSAHLELVAVFSRVR